MTDEQQNPEEALPKPKTDMDEYYERSRRPLITQPKTPLGRIGCGALLVVWFFLLTLPFIMLWLGTGRVIQVPRGGDVPNASQHPQVRVQLVMERDFRGLQFTSTNVVTDEDTLFCYGENVNYLLWENRGGEQQNRAQCQCYERDIIDADWQAQSIQPIDQCN